MDITSQPAVDPLQTILVMISDVETSKGSCNNFMLSSEPLLVSAQAVSSSSSFFYFHFNNIAYYSYYCSYYFNSPHV